MACNSNYVATMDRNCWLSSKNSPSSDDVCSHGGGILMRIAANRRLVAKIA